MIVFDRLWTTMKEKGVSQYKLIKEYKISTGQLDRLRKNENVNTYTLDQLCRILNCGLEDIAEYIDKWKTGRIIPSGSLTCLTGCSKKKQPVKISRYKFPLG